MKIQALLGWAHGLAAGAAFAAALGGSGRAAGSGEEGNSGGSDGEFGDFHIRTSVVLVLLVWIGGTCAGRAEPIDCKLAVILAGASRD